MQMNTRRLLVHYKMQILGQFGTQYENVPNVP